MKAVFVNGTMEQDIKQEIARRCGYTDQHYFSYCFKKYSADTPCHDDAVAVFVHIVEVKTVLTLQ